MAETAYTVASDNETTGEGKAYSEVALGIDIGTSQCSVALWTGSVVELLQNSRNQTIMQSYVTFKDEVPSGGVSGQLTHEHEIFSGSAIFNMKRLIGRMDTDPVVHASKSLPFLVQTLDIGARPLIAALVNNAWRTTTPEEVLALYLVELRVMAEMQVKRLVRDVVLSVPVSFTRFQLTRIERACAMAGLHVLRLMPEPTAVALLYAQQQLMSSQENTGDEYEKIAVIFNMGAGYCDVCVTATAGGVSQIKALSGSTVGGEDILQNVMRHVLPNMDSLFSKHGINEITAIGLLRIATQDAIHKLSSQNVVRIEADLGNGLRVDRIMDRSEFEELNQSIFEKCENLITQCLLNAKLVVGNINDVILVGGCSYIPKIRISVLSLCGKDTPYMGMKPFEAAVYGAALEGAVASGVSDSTGSLDLLTIQAVPFSIGIRADGNKFVPIICRNATMPARKELWFTTAHDNQTEVVVVVYEGDGNTLEENHLLGYFKIMGIPPAPKGTPEISICMNVDTSNVLKVYAGVGMPGQYPVMPFIEVRMPNVDDGHGWCAEAMTKRYGSTVDLNTLQKKISEHLKV